MKNEIMFEDGLKPVKKSNFNLNDRPERSKRDDLNINNGYFPPPWNPYEHPEKTEGWIEFQKELRKDPKYYLGCGTLNSMET